jgi:hypothetical protein
MKKLDDAAHEWVFETNGHKWSNNDDTAGDNYGSFIAGAKWQKEQAKEMEEKQKIEFACQVYDKYNFGTQEISFREECEQLKQQEQ